MAMANLVNISRIMMMGHPHVLFIIILGIKRHHVSIIFKLRSHQTHLAEWVCTYSVTTLPDESGSFSGNA